MLTHGLGRPFINRSSEFYCVASPVSLSRHGNVDVHWYDVDRGDPEDGMCASFFHFSIMLLKTFKIEVNQDALWN